eukprot:gene13816-biopygen5301
MVPHSRLRGGRLRQLAPGSRARPVPEPNCNPVVQLDATAIAPRSCKSSRFPVAPHSFNDAVPTRRVQSRGNSLPSCDMFGGRDGRPVSKRKGNRADGAAARNVAAAVGEVGAEGRELPATSARDRCLRTGV